MLLSIGGVTGMYHQSHHFFPWDGVLKLILSILICKHNPLNLSFLGSLGWQVHTTVPSYWMSGIWWTFFWAGLKPQSSCLNFSSNYDYRHESLVPNSFIIFVLFHFYYCYTRGTLEHL
jgi:hypothetical protein